jgi:hypothetical protein
VGLLKQALQIEGKKEIRLDDKDSFIGKHRDPPVALGGMVQRGSGPRHLTMTWAMAGVWYGSLALLVAIADI